MIDLRSDTVTRPGSAMREAMFSASVGDDVFGEDPTVSALETLGASMFGKESGLFCPSGTMTNQIAIRLHTRPGDEVICDRTAHVYNYEGGGIASNSGASVRLLDGDRGRFTAGAVQESIQPDNPHYARTSLVVIENTVNRGGGSCWDLNEIQKIASVCKKQKLRLHLDGARLFNAIIARREDPLEYGRLFDTISICLSKGLGAPVGSLLLGSKESIHEAIRIRKVFGGGMRQAGYLAAAGFYALRHNVQRLEEDHSRAREIEKALLQLSWIKEVLPVETNIVVFRTRDDKTRDDVLKQLAAKDILAVAFGSATIRMVTHLDVNDPEIETLIRALKALSVLT